MVYLYLYMHNFYLTLHIISIKKQELMQQDQLPRVACDTKCIHINHGHDSHDSINESGCKITVTEIMSNNSRMPALFHWES